MKVLIVGLGSIAQKHIHALRTMNKNILLFAVRSGHSSNNIEGVVNLSPEDLDTLNADFAIISDPTYRHAATLTRLLPLGIPLMIEKPLFKDARAEEYALVQQVNSAGILNYVACNLRFHPCIRYFKEEILPGLGVINEVNIYGGSYLPDWRPGRDFREVYSAKTELGGGVHLDHIHELDYAYWFFGKPVSNSSRLFSKSDIHINAVDNAHYLWEYERFCVNISLNYYRRHPKRQIEVLTDKGEYLIDLIEPRIQFNNNVIASYEIDRYNTYIRQMEYFVKSIEGNKQMMNNVNEAWEVLKLCLNEL
jgi:predicted dehydrogenase